MTTPQPGEQPAQPAEPRSAAKPLGDDPVMRMVFPVGRSWWAIAAGYAGLFSLLVFPAPLALLLGIIAVWHIRKNPGKHGLGRAGFGVVMGLAGSALLLALLLR